MSDVSFGLMDRHVEVPTKAPIGGKVVLSRLPRGRSFISSPAPSLKLVLEGEEVYEVDGRMLCVRPGQFLYLDAGADCVAHLRQPTQGLCLVLPSSPAAPDENPVIGRAMVLPTATTALGRAVATYASRIAREPENGGRLAGKLVAEVERGIAAPMIDICAAMERLKASKPTTRRALYQKLEHARAHLHEVLDREVELAELAALAGVSRFHLARYFTLAFGLSPVAYHRSLRLDRAAGLLREGETCLGRVASLTGYSDQVALNHAFSRKFGMPPLRWSQGRVR